MGRRLDVRLADLDVRDLQTLSALYEHGSLSAAASSLGMTVSALSHRVSDMERRMNVVLAERTTHGLRLTSDALRVLPYAQAALRNVRAAESVLSRKDEPGRRIGVARMLLTGEVGTFLVDALSERRPDAEMASAEISTGGAMRRWAVGVGNSREVETWVLARSVDLGLVRVGGSRPGLHFAGIGEDHLTAVAAPALLANQGTKPDPFALPWIGVADHTGHGRAVREELRRAGVSLYIMVETDSLEFAHRLAQAGVAAVVLPQSMVGADLAEGRLVLIEVPGALWPSRQIALVWHAQTELSGWQLEWVTRLRHRLARKTGGSDVSGARSVTKGL